MSKPFEFFKREHCYRYVIKNSEDGGADWIYRHEANHLLNKFGRKMIQLGQSKWTCNPSTAEKDATDNEALIICQRPIQAAKVECNYDTEAMCVIKTGKIALEATISALNANLNFCSKCGLDLDFEARD